MSSDDDSYSFNESQTFDRIVELLKLRTQPIRRKLYDNEPAARRSLKVQKIFKKPAADEVENLVFDRPAVNDVAIQDDSEVMQAPHTSPTRIPIRAQKKSIFCSTPMAIDTIKKFTISLSPVKKSVRRISQLMDQTSQEEYNLKLMQPRIVLTDVLNLNKGSKIVSPERPSRIVNKKKPNSNLNARQLSPSSQIVILKPVNHKLKNGTKSYSVTQNSPSKSADTSSRSIPSKTTNCSSHGCETLKPPETRLNCRYLGNSESNRGRSGFPTEDFRPELSLKLSSAGRHMPQSSDLDPKSSTLNATHRNAELSNLNSKRSESLKGSSQQKQVADISNSLKNSILRECSASSEIDNLLVIPENDEMENGTSTSPTSKHSNHNDILNVEVTQKTSQPHPQDPSLVGVSTSSFLVTQSISKTQQVSRSQNPVLKRVRKKKINDSYSNFLALEKSANRKSSNRKSSNSGSKRKLYSSEYQSENLTITKDSGSGSTQGDRNFKVTPTLIQSSFMIDSEGFKVPKKMHLLNKSSRKENADDSIGPVQSEIGIIAENIRILNKSQAALTAEKKHPEKKKKRKPSTPKIAHNNVEGDTTGLRRSTRAKHVPMTFWTVHKEPLVDYQTKFYTKMIKSNSLPKKAKQKPKKAHPIAESVEPILEESQERRINVVIEEVETIPIGKNTNLQGTRNEEKEFRSAFTLGKPNRQERNKFDSALQEPTEYDQMNPHIKFLKKFGADCLSDEDSHRTQRITSLSDDLIGIDKLDFRKLGNMPGIEFSFVPNTNEMIGFLKLQCGSKKSLTRTSRKYFLTLMLFTETSVTVKVNEKATEMILGELDLVQLPPNSKYELINNSAKPAILMTARTLVK